MSGPGLAQMVIGEDRPCTRRLKAMTLLGELIEPHRDHVSRCVRCVPLLLALGSWGVEGCGGEPARLDDGGRTDAGSTTRPPRTDAGAQVAPDPDSGGMPARRVEGRELVPLRMTLTTSGGSGADGGSVRTVEQISGLPRGARFDATSQTLLWIPQLGQTGEHEVWVRTAPASGKAEDEATSNDVPLILSIAPAKAEHLMGGPPRSYATGDVGFVFIHGKADEDMCEDPKDVEDYWGNGPDLLAGAPEHRTLACYDGRKAVADTAEGVAKQILSAPCGRYDKCIVVAHSMGGLMITHMLTHVRAPEESDAEPELFRHNALFRAVRERVLFVISIASSSGGSRAADIVIDAEDRGPIQRLGGEISRVFGQYNGSTENLVVKRATRVVAPLQEDPGVPFFMIAGYSVRILDGASGLSLDLVGALLDDEETAELFNGATELGLLDALVDFHSRSDGLVSFRSACGIASDSGTAGPGHDSELEKQFEYCYASAKRPNHYLWFLINLNHFLIREPTDRCQDKDNRCRVHVPSAEHGGLVHDPSLDGMDTQTVIKTKLAPREDDDATLRPVDVKLEL